ncbi:terpene synthase 10-like [Neltuma alba]|uniref:terpene synthase 10-like n=1 Tax=Neltuma alba TaxID=207710 RepID=UPI0010A4D06A|nr:terpene synthase 10-like [Prosopis alba]
MFMLQLARGVKDRRVVSKVHGMITIIDDIYDVHGSLEELILFTEVVNRWDINAMDELPDCMKISFLALNNFVNEVAFDFLKENGRNIIPHIKKVWADLCKSYLVEARWCKLP